MTATNRTAWFAAATVRALALALVAIVSGCQSTLTQPPEPSMQLDDAVLMAIASPEPQWAYTGGGEVAPGVELPATDLWSDIRAGFRLDRQTGEKRVRQELAWLKRHPRYLHNMRARLERHLAYIHRQVTARDLPSELALLPIVESALDPYAFSHGGAAGLWQFVPATARHYGLDRNWWYDGRRDPVAATDAALDYLEYLHRRFSDWHLALAGYNAGEGNVMRAQRRARPGAGFFELKLPRETSAYVPRLLALAELVANPDAYGVTLPPLGREIPFDVVRTGGQLDLTVASEATGIALDTLYEWNPALSQWSTPPDGPDYLLIPAAQSDRAAARIAAIPDESRVRWLRVTVKPGDTLSQLARRHRTDVESLKRVNNLRTSRITVGDSLLIPASPKALNTRFASRHTGATYIVRSGDSLWTISRSYNVPVTRLMKANHVGPKDYLRVGQKLTVPGVKDAGVQPTREAEIRKVRYGVRKGDSLARIAQRFNVRVRDIARWNQLSLNDYLHPGQTLLLYVNASE